MQFEVGHPFGPFHTGDRITGQKIFSAIPGANIPWLIEKKSLIPIGGASATLLPGEEPSQGDVEIVAGLQKRIEELEDERDQHKAASIAAQNQVIPLTARVKELEAALASEKARPKAAGTRRAAPAATEPVTEKSTEESTTSPETNSETAKE